MKFQIDPTAAEFQTPLMKQFIHLKNQCEGALLFFRMGDFYELFAEDAIIAAPILGVTLTSRNKASENPVPMAGIPFHSATNYIQKLLNAGKKVAIAEQILPEGMTTDQIKGIVDRQIIRTFTPAVQFELTQDSNPKYLSTLTTSDSKKFVLSLFDPATGKVRISNLMSASELQNESALQSIQHFLNLGSKVPTEILKVLETVPHILIEDISHNWVSSQNRTDFLKKQYGKLALHPLLDSELAQAGLAVLLHYVAKSQGIERLPHLHEPEALHEANRLITGPHTHTHLDTQDLFELINQTATSMGARLLKQELHAPLKNVKEIKIRQEAVQELGKKSFDALQIHDQLKEVYDLDRILGRISTGLANPRDTYALGQSLHYAFLFHEKLAQFEAHELKKLTQQFGAAKKSLETISARILKTQVAQAPTHTREGGIFELGTDEALDHLIKLTTEGEQYLIALEIKERETTGIGSLKVKYNRVFGYFIEISSANLKNVPAHYQRKQTTVGGERFFTEELKKFEEEILSAGSKQKALEAKLFQKLVDDLIDLSEPLKLLSQSISELDADLALSFLTLKSGWSMPEIDESYEFELKGSRHPVVDQSLKGEFVANDVKLSPETARTLLITGPNMGGKSTLMRQMAEIILLGQMGAPVPAQSARFGVFHSLYTRIGAQDAITKGQSTFMVEMVELAHILNFADARSFVVLDEIGRGTSTFDGMSVAGASLEYLHVHSKARIVFATHYHELTELEAKLPGLKNAYMKVLDEKGKLTFLYELALGRSSKSFGIQVAELAGLPKGVIKKSWEILKGLENGSHAISSESSSQLSLFASVPDEMEVARDENLAASLNSGLNAGLTLDPKSIEIAQSIRTELEALDLNLIRPVEALNILVELQGKYLTQKSV